MLRTILDILLPKFCVGCGREEKYVCDKCEVFLSEVPPSKEVFSIWEYEGLMEKLIEGIKFKGKYHIIDELVEKAFQKIELNLPPDTVITYVPMWPKKERERGFNQAKLIARKLAENAALHSVLPTRRFAPRRTLTPPFRAAFSASSKVLPLLKKTKDNRSQVGLGPKERKENVRDVFKFQGSFVPKNVLLVDDVYTTGATAKECVRVLKRAGVENVWVFTLARKLNI